MRVRRVQRPSSRGRGRATVLNDGFFWLTLSGMAGLLAVGDVSTLPTGNPPLAGVLFGLLALAELGWQGWRSLRCAGRRFTGVDRVGGAILRLLRRSHAYPVRFGSRREIRSSVICRRFAVASRKQTLTTSFSSIMPRGSTRPLLVGVPSSAAGFNQPMNEAVDDFRRQVRHRIRPDQRGVPGSDRVESDPGWPVAAEGDWQGGAPVCHRPTRRSSARVRRPLGRSLTGR